MPPTEFVAPAGITRLMARARQDPDVLAVLLFGSHARGGATPASDHDVCLVLAAPPQSDLDASEKRLQYRALGDLDVGVFEATSSLLCSAVGVRRYEPRRITRGDRLVAQHENLLGHVAFAFSRSRGAAPEARGRCRCVVWVAGGSRRSAMESPGRRRGPRGRAGGP